MTLCRRFVSALAWALVPVFVVGCSKEPEKKKLKIDREKSAAMLKASSAGKPIEKPVVKIEAVKEPAPVAIPAVKLSNELLATCLVKVGDRLPDAELPDTTGKRQSISSLCGPKLTVVFLWETNSEYAVSALEDLDADVAKPFLDKGVRVIGIDLRDGVDAVKEAVQQAGAGFPILLDPDGAYFAKIATDKVPRTYLIDAQGQILWFDVEYSRGTRRDLLAAVEVALSKN
jgi:peroxiredoxin